MMSVRKVWIVKENEFPSLLSGKDRASRAVMLAEYFIEAGCEVTAFSSLWSHRLKSYIDCTGTEIVLKPGLTLFVIPSKKTYSRNISFARIAQQREIGRLFKAAIKNQPKPDLIYCSWPLMETSYEAVRYGKEHNVPVVIDIRDMWPDIFVQPFPHSIQWAARLCIDLLFRRKASYALRNATKVTSTIPKALEMPKRYGRFVNRLDQTVFHCYRRPIFLGDEMSKSLDRWKNNGVDGNTFSIVYFGTIGKRIPDFDTVIAAIDELGDANVRLVLCGNGDDYERLSTIAKSRPYLVMAGLRNQLDMYTLASISQAGLIPYRNTPDFQDSLPTKLSEYLASSLIVLTSLSGLAREVLEGAGCGFFYKDSKCLASILAKLVRDKDETDKMKIKALELYQKEFDANVIYRRFVGQMLDLVDNISPVE